VPHLYFWKSAKWVRGLELRERDEPGFWEDGAAVGDRAHHPHRLARSVASPPRTVTRAPDRSALLPERRPLLPNSTAVDEVEA
jgi:DMSO/TMAO reductase YedYZ molybdopterin-dependent catalytic subunit